MLEECLQSDCLPAKADYREVGYQGGNKVGYAHITSEITSSTHAEWSHDSSASTQGPKASLVISDTDHKTRLAVAKITKSLQIRSAGVVDVERHSVYGAVIMMPQLARTAKWSKFFSLLTIRSYIFLLVNISVQALILIMLSKEESVMDIFAGQMNLCDFGAGLSTCPDGPHCTGPGGTRMSAPRLYDYTTWATRTYVRDSLLALFPDREREVHEKVDPGEYGLESYACRVLCCFIFVISVMNELVLIWGMVKLLYHVPTADEPWIITNENSAEDAENSHLSHHPLHELPPQDDPSPRHDPPQILRHLERKESSIEHHLPKEEAHFDRDVEIRIAGMPLKWKLINLLVVLLPKALLWKIIAETGVVFLMETSTIENIIVNSVALTFVLNIDEMMCESLMAQDTKTLLERLEVFPLYNTAEVSEWSNDQFLIQHDRENRCSFGSFEEIREWLVAVLPIKLFLVLALTLFFVAEYYATKCTQTKDGNWVSKSMHLPKSVNLSPLQAFFPNFLPIEAEEQPFWEYHEN